mgnify:FL=1
MELVIRISRLVQVIIFPNVYRLRQNRKTLPCAPKRRGLRSAYALPERPLRSMGLYSHSASKRQPKPGPSSQSLDISDYVGGALGLRVAHSLEGEVLRSRAR